MNSSGNHSQVRLLRALELHHDIDPFVLLLWFLWTWRCFLLSITITTLGMVLQWHITIRLSGDRTFC